MKKVCQNCNQTFPDENIFCPNCGKKLIELPQNQTDSPTPTHTRTRQFNKNKPTEVPTTPTKKPRKAKAKTQVKAKKFNTKILLVVLVVLVVLIGIATSIFVITSKKDSYSAQDGVILLLNEDEQPIVFCNGKCYTNIDGYIDYDCNASENAIGIIDSDKTLWLINSRGEFKVDNDVSSFSISLDGNCVVYTTSEVKGTLYPESTSKDSISYSTGYLKRYYSSKNTSEIIDNDVLVSCWKISTLGNMDFLTISESGESICYIKNINYANDTLTWKNYVYSNSITSSFATQSDVYAINDGATICYWDNTEKKTIYYGNILTNNVSKLFTYDSTYDRNSSISLIFNKDCSECVATNNEKTYIVEGEQEKQNVGAFKTRNAYTDSFNTYSDYVKTLNVDSLNGCILRSHKSNEWHYYCLLKDNGSWYYSEISNKSTYQNLSSDRQYVYGIKQSTSKVLHKTSVTNLSDETEIDIQVTQFQVSTDDRYIYYIDNDKNLFCYDGKDSTRIDIDVDNIYQHNNVFYYIKDVQNECGTLYCSSEGSAGQKVKYGNDVYQQMYVCDGGILFISVYDNTSSIDYGNIGTLYKINNTSDAIKLQEDVYTKGGYYG